jgi:hypothetical protein
VCGPPHTCRPEGSTVAGARAGSAAASSAAFPGQNTLESQAAGWKGETVTHPYYTTRRCSLYPLTIAHSSASSRAGIKETETGQVDVQWIMLIVVNAIQIIEPMSVN